VVRLLLACYPTLELLPMFARFPYLSTDRRSLNLLPKRAHRGSSSELRTIVLRSNGGAGSLLLAAGALCSMAQAQTAIPGITSNGNMVTVTAPGGLQTPSINVEGTGAGALALRGGAAPGPLSANTVQISAPIAVSSYALTLPKSGPDLLHPLLAFTSDGTGYFTSVPASTTQTVNSPTLGSNTFSGPQVVNGGTSSLPLVITSSSSNGASIALDNSSAGGIYTLLYSNGNKNAGIWDYTHLRDTLTCSQTDGAVSCGATHVVSTSGQPTIVAGVGAGGGAFTGFDTESDNAPSDQSGVIHVATGGTPGPNSVLATITFSQPWLRTIASGIQAANYAPACTISPANAAAASLSGPNSVYASVATKSSFALVSNVVSIAANTNYLWTYKCM
ncbi:MAG: hypothetical protein ACRYGF_04585, partial [Janthinobacterium lividum]